MNWMQANFATLYRIDFFLIFVAAMSFIVYAAVRARRKAPQSHQQAPKTEKKNEPLWSEAELRKIYSDYRHCRVVFGLSVSTIRVIHGGGGGRIEPERRKRIVSRAYYAYAQMKALAIRYNEISKQALEFGEFPGDLPRGLDV